MHDRHDRPAPDRVRTIFRRVMSVAKRELLATQDKLRADNNLLLDDQAKIRAINAGLLGDQAKIRATNESLLGDQAKIRATNESLLGDQAKIRAVNAGLLADQRRISEISDRLLSDQAKIRATTERELLGASLIYRRDDPIAQDKIRRLARLFTPASAKSLQKVRVGRRGDGGYVMIDDFSDVRVAFSFGIGDDVSWDIDIANRGIKVMQYDHSVESAPQQHDNFVFHKTKIEPEKSATGESVASVLQAEGAPGRGNILKIDIEATEWEVFDTAAPADLDRFSQIVCELHDFERMYNAQWYDRAYRVMTKLLTLFEVVHIHGSNTGRLAVFSNMAFPTAMEITFLNKANHTFEHSDVIYPTQLDAPTDPDFADIFLGDFKF